MNLWFIQLQVLYFRQSNDLGSDDPEEDLIIIDATQLNDDNLMKPLTAEERRSNKALMEKILDLINKDANLHIIM